MQRGKRHGKGKKTRKIKKMIEKEGIAREQDNERER